MEPKKKSKLLLWRKCYVCGVQIGESQKDASGFWHPGYGCTYRADWIRAELEAARRRGEVK
jgi:hypothetical protein